MTALKFGIAAGLPHVHDYQRWARLAEGAGYDLLGFGDSQCLIPEMCVSLAAMATVTERVTLCPTVSNPLTRHPSVMASAFGALQQLSTNRTMLGLGSGDSAALSVGERPASLSAMRAYCNAFSALVRGDTASYRGKQMRLEWDVPAVPLMLAAGGPKTMQLAGQVADAVLLGCGMTEDVVRDAIDRVQSAAAAAGRPPIEIWVFSKLYIADTPQAAWHELAWTLAASAHHAFRHGYDGKFVPERWRSAIDQIQSNYVVREHNNLAATGTTNADLVRQTGLADFLGPRFMIAGPVDVIVDRIHELNRWGVTGFFTSGMFGEPFAYTRQIAELVLSRAKSARRTALQAGPEG